MIVARLLVDGLDDGVAADLARGLAERLEALGLGAGLDVALDGREAVVLDVGLVARCDDRHVAAEIAGGSALALESGATHDEAESEDGGGNHERTEHVGVPYQYQRCGTQGKRAAHRSGVTSRRRGDEAPGAGLGRPRPPKICVERG